MNIKTKSILLLTTIMFFSACSALGSSYQLESIYPETTKILIQRLMALEKDNQVFVSGKLKKRLRTSVAPSGHMDIAVYNVEGELLTETTTSYSSSLNLRRVQRRGGNRFRASLDIIPPTGSLIKVAFHADNFKPKSNLEHESIIAR